jgi:histidyl-tRNA synthetase
MSKPSIPQGTRDFGPETVRKRNFIFTTIRTVFERYGFQPLETPAMENLETLMGKYGEEGDKLIFKILNNGLDHPNKREQVLLDFEKVLQGKNTKGITERALRYDLTIPFARYVAMNHGQLVFPFKRYQVQPVWRADRPQKGRYREFYQCDADVVGSNSLWNEVELAQIYHDVFMQLQINRYELHINSRKILAALAENCGGADKLTDITTAIDKLDKIGIEKVKEELAQRGLTSDQVTSIEEYLSINGSNEEKLQQVTTLLGHLESAKKGIEEISFIIDTLQTPGSRLPTPDSRLILDLTLARGLNYYTGIIFEAKAPAEVKIGSIGGGGRYDDLTGLFGVPNIPGVGISFGVDRIYDVMEELQLFPQKLLTGTQVLFFNLGTNESSESFRQMQKLRANNIACEMYYESAKFDKQFKYAEKKQIPFIIIIGSKELEEQSCVIRDLRNSRQQSIPLADLENVLFI